VQAVQVMRFELRTVEDRRKAFRELLRMVLDDIAEKEKIPTFHVVHVEKDGSIDNHYMTPVSLEPVDDRGNIGVWAQDFEFFLKLLLRLKNIIEVEYDPERPAVIFTYAEFE
jgi:hypothetical protein